MSDGEAQLTGGRFQLKHASGELSVDPDCCEFMPHCPCSIEEWAALVAGTAVCGGFVREYRLKDYQDGDLDPCTGSVPPCGWPHSGDVWQGNVLAGSSGWWEGACEWYTNAILPIVMNKNGETNNVSASLVLVPCNFWQLVIRGPEWYCSIWSGKKFTGSTPAGIYTRDYMGGCDQHSTLEIVEA
jgi:hypothetical protein